MLSVHSSSLAPHSINKPIQHLYVECLINSAPLGYEFKVDDNPAVEKPDENCFDLGL
jgi:hypothetical protein